MEFKGTKGGWKVKHSESKNSWNIIGTALGGRYKISKCDYIINNELSNDLNNREIQEQQANAMLISKAPEMLDMLNKARIELSRIKSSMMAHPDCTIGSEFDDYTSSAQDCENEIEQLIKETTEL